MPNPSSALPFDATPFDGLWERLLRGGVGRRHARRYVAELHDHLEDLIAEERRAEGGARDPEARALARLGSPEALAGAMIARRELRAWSAQAPVAAYLIVPPLVLLAGAALALAGVVMTASWLRGANAAPSDLPAWTATLAHGAGLFSNAILPVLLGLGLAAMAIRQRAAPLWPVLGLVALSVIGAALQVEVTLPSASAHGEIGLAPSFGSLSAWTGYGGRLAVNLALTLTPYAGLGMRRAA